MKKTAIATLNCNSELPRLPWMLGMQMLNNNIGCTKSISLYSISNLYWVLRRLWLSSNAYMTIIIYYAAYKPQITHNSINKWYFISCMAPQLFLLFINVVVMIMNGWQFLSHYEPLEVVFSNVIGGLTWF